VTRILVTGSSGFIGSNLCQRLLGEGYTVKAVDNKNPKFDHPDAVETHRCDLLGSPKLPDADLIIHLAAHAQVQPVVATPSLAVENIEMTRTVLDEADRMGAALIHTSSREVYGPAIRPSESEATVDCPNGYAASKLGSEAIINSYHHCEDLPAASLRLSNVYGPNDLNPRVIPIFIALASIGKKLEIYGSGKVLDFVHVHDVCSAIVASIERINQINGEVINIGSGSGTGLTEIANQIINRVDQCPGKQLLPDRHGDVDRYVSNLSKANALLGFNPETELEEGLSETVEWYLDNEHILDVIRSKID